MIVTLSYTTLPWSACCQGKLKFNFDRGHLLFALRQLLCLHAVSIPALTT